MIAVEPCRKDYPVSQDSEEMNGYARSVLPVTTGPVQSVGNIAYSQKAEMVNTYVANATN